MGEKPLPLSRAISALLAYAVAFEGTETARIQSSDIALVTVKRPATLSHRAASVVPASQCEEFNGQGRSVRLPAGTSVCCGWNHTVPLALDTNAGLNWYVSYRLGCR
jgi:hypothetical protein